MLLNEHDQVFWCKRVGQNAWQFPQGGVQKNESPRAAMLRELDEETGLQEAHIDILGQTPDWLRYQLPEQFQRKSGSRRCIGQKQIWFLLRFCADERDINLNKHATPEFDDWRWLDYRQAAEEVIYFKRQVYRQALAQLLPLLK